MKFKVHTLPWKQHNNNITTKSLAAEDVCDMIEKLQSSY